MLVSGGDPPRGAIWRLWFGCEKKTTPQAWLVNRAIRVIARDEFRDVDLCHILSALSGKSNLGRDHMYAHCFCCRVDYCLRTWYYTMSFSLTE